MNFITRKILHYVANKHPEYLKELLCSETDQNKDNSDFNDSTSLINKAEIARRLGVSRAYISLIFSNKRKAPKMRARISRLLDKEIKAA